MALALVVACFAAGCDREAAPDGDPAPPPGRAAPDADGSVDAPTDPTERTPEAEAATEGSGDAEADADAEGRSSPAAEEPVSEAAWEAAVAEIEALERDARFDDALRRVRAMKARVTSGEREGALSAMRQRLVAHDRAATGLAYAVEKLDSERAAVQEAARQRLLRAGETGRIILRRVVREGRDEAARVAAAALSARGDDEAIDSYVARFAEAPGTATAEAMVRALRSGSGAIEAGQAAALSRRVLERQADDPSAEPTEGVMALLAELADRVPRAAWARAYELVRADERFAQRELVNWLEAAYAGVCEGDAGAFGELVGDDGAAAALTGYVRRAGEASSDEVAGWALHGVEAFRPFDQGAWGRYYDAFKSGTLKGEAGIEAFDLNTRAFPFVDHQHISAQWEGRLRVPEDGAYTFEVTCGHGIRVSVGGRVLVEHWDVGPEKTRTAEVELDAGLHPLSVEYFRRGGAGRLKIEWRGPGVERGVLGGNHLLRSPAPPSKRDALADD